MTCWSKLTRRCAQALSLPLLLPWLLVGFLRCPFGIPFVHCGSCPLGDCTGRALHLPVWGVIAVTALLLGRVFCGWICPLGTLQDLVPSRRRLPRKPRPSIRTTADRLGRWLKVGVLVVCAVWVWQTHGDTFRDHPYVVRSSSGWNLESVWLAWRMGTPRYRIRAVLLLGILLMPLTVPRFWCRYLCPLGALLAGGSRLQLFGLRRDRRRCIDCGRYPAHCDVGTTPGTPECTVCGDCVSECPVDAITLKKDPLGSDSPR